MESPTPHPTQFRLLLAYSNLVSGSVKTILKTRRLSRTVLEAQNKGSRGGHDPDGSQNGLQDIQNLLESIARRLSNSR